MIYNPDRHHRRSIRLSGYDYSRAGAYFVTICAKDRACLFGEVKDGEMRHNDAGRMVERWWHELNRKFPNVETDEYVVMPNHFHGIIVIGDSNIDDREIDNDDCVYDVGADLCVCPCPGADHDKTDRGAHAGAPLHTIVQWFKTMTTNEYIRGVKSFDWPAFPGKLWQRNYYEHVIRNDDALNRIRQYIIDNPAQWAFDRENPAATGTHDHTPQQAPEEAWQR